mgnify:CR=1 FL=1
MGINCNTGMVIYIGDRFIPSRHTKTMKRMTTDSNWFHAKLYLKED